MNVLEEYTEIVLRHHDPQSNKRQKNKEVEMPKKEEVMGPMLVSSIPKKCLYLDITRPCTSSETIDEKPRCPAMALLWAGHLMHHAGDYPGDHTCGNRSGMNFSGQSGDLLGRFRPNFRERGVDCRRLLCWWFHRDIV